MKRLIPTFLLTLIAAMASAQTPVLLRTFNNPAPGAGDYFGAGMTALGSDRVLISAPYDDTTATNAGVVYLFHTNGTLLTTITKPTAVVGGFGEAIATLGNNRIAVGSGYGDGLQLFSTNGVWLTNIGDISGNVSAVAAVGNDKLLIGDLWADLDPQIYVSYGAAYLYSTNGALLMTFNNFNPGAYGLGHSVAAFGSDRILVSAAQDYAAYLYSTNGALLMTFNNPAPFEYNCYGMSLAAVGTDRVLVGSPSYGTNTEAVYLFNTNGTLLLTITNPAPAAEDFFGHSIAVLGNDRVVIGAPDDDITPLNSGSAYVFSLNNGALLATINNPTPGVGDRFGLCMAPFGNNCVLIAAPQDNGVGTAYLFNIPSASPPPSLTIQATITNTVVVSWPSPSTGFVLQQNTNGLSSVNWSNVTATLQDNGTTKTLLVNPTGGNRFFRLFKE
jgi:FG-GAP repeat